MQIVFRLGQFCFKKYTINPLFTEKTKSLFNVVLHSFPVEVHAQPSILARRCQNVCGDIFICPTESTRVDFYVFSSSYFLVLCYFLVPFGRPVPFWSSGARVFRCRGWAVLNHGVLL